MPMPPQEKIEMRDFNGIINNIDPRDIPPGAAEEAVNICSIVQGEMQVRLGYKEVRFD